MNIFLIQCFYCPKMQKKKVSFNCSLFMISCQWKGVPVEEVICRCREWQCEERSPEEKACERHYLLEPYLSCGEGTVLTFSSLIKIHISIHRYVVTNFIKNMFAFMCHLDDLKILSCNVSFINYGTRICNFILYFVVEVHLQENLGISHHWIVLIME